MVHELELQLLELIRDTYDFIAWPGVVILMALEVVIFLIPSEVVMPLAGWMLVKLKGLGPEWLVLAGLLGAFGNTLGALFLYYVGVGGGRPLVVKYGRYLLISHDDLDAADRFFARWGTWAVFLGRMVPLVRSFVSVVAGVSRMHLGQFTVFTFAGSFPWAFGLATLGYILGENWEAIRTWMRPVDIPVAVVLAGLVLWYIVRHVRRAWEAPQPSGPEA